MTAPTAARYKITDVNSGRESFVSDSFVAAIQVDDAKNGAISSSDVLANFHKRIQKMEPGGKIGFAGIVDGHFHEFANVERCGEARVAA